MKRMSSLHVISALLAVTTACGAGQEGAAPSASTASSAVVSEQAERPHFDCGRNHGDFDGDGVSEAVEDQLEIARKAVCKFRRVEAALAAGYHDTGLPCIPGQGYHFIKDSLVGTTNIREPSVLMYTLSGELNSPEWVAPIDSFPVPPSIFGQTMHADDDLGLWILHVWVWKPNPNGVFEDVNPTVTCP